MKKILISMMLLMSVASVYAQTENDEMSKEINQAIEASVGTLNFSELMTTQMQPLVEQGVIKAEKLQPLIKDVEAWMVPLLKEKMAALYRQHFTLEEMKQVNAYISSPIGQKFMKLTPKFSAAGMEIVTTPEAQKKIQEILMRHLGVEE